MGATVVIFTIVTGEFSILGLQLEKFKLHVEKHCICYEMVLTKDYLLGMKFSHRVDLQTQKILSKCIDSFSIADAHPSTLDFVPLLNEVGKIPSLARYLLPCYLLQLPLLAHLLPLCKNIGQK